MAEAFVNEYSDGSLRAESAGLEPGKMNPYVVKVMKEKEIDISKNSCDSVQDFLKEGREYDYVVTVCDEASAETCPVFPGGGEKEHWGFKDPSSFGGIEEEKLTFTRNIRDAIEEKVREFLGRVQA